MATYLKPSEITSTYSKYDGKLSITTLSEISNIPSNPAISSLDSTTHVAKIDASPAIHYILSYEAIKSGSNIIYTFYVTIFIKKTAWLHEGYTIDGVLTINDISSNSVNFKSASDLWGRSDTSGDGKFDDNDDPNAYGNDIWGVRKSISITIPNNGNIARWTLNFNGYHTSSDSKVGTCTLRGTINQYSISYYPNGGSGNVSGPTYKTPGIDVNLTSNTFILDDIDTQKESFTISVHHHIDKDTCILSETKAANKTTIISYKHTSWNTKSDGSGDSYELGGLYTKDESCTMYAIFTPTVESVEYTNNTLENFEKITGYTNSRKICKLTLINTYDGSSNEFLYDATDSYVFDKWYLTQIGYGSVEFADNQSFTEDTELYALYKVGSTELPVINITQEVPNSRDGYEFIGWSTEDGNPEKIVSNEFEITEDTYTEVTLYAVWKANGIVNVRINGVNKKAIPYVYDTDRFKQIMPHVYKNNKYNICG